VRSRVWSSTKRSRVTRALFIPIGSCSLGVPTKEPGTEKYEVTFSVTPAAFKRLVLLIPGLGELYKFVSLDQNIVMDDDLIRVKL